MQGESFRNILRIPPGNWGSPVQVTLQEASFGSCFVVVVGLKMDQEPWKCRVGAQPGCRAGAEPPGLGELQDLPIPSTPDPAWRALSAHRVLQQQPWPWHPNGNPALKASSATKQGQNVVFYTLETMWKETQCWCLGCCAQTRLGREQREQELREGREEGFSFSLCVLAWLCPSLHERKGLEFSK